MKALVLEAYNRLVYQDVPEPEIGPLDVLVQVKATGICGSDIHGMDGSSGRRIPPLIMGHESAGVVAALGEQVTEWQIGDRVTFDSTIYCGECYFCQRGEINLCDNRKVLGVSPGEYRQHGAFAEYVAVPQRIVYAVPDELTFEEAAFVEPVSIAVHAVNRASIQPDDSAVVIGAGMIGLLVIQVLRSAGCSKIIAVDLNAQRLELAQELGAHIALRSDEGDVVERIKEHTDGRGANVSLEVVGISPTVQLAVNCVRKGGRVVLVGNIKPEVTLPLQVAVSRELTILGSCASQGEYPVCLDMLANGSINVKALTSAIAPLSEGAEWFHKLYNPDSGLLKVILTPMETSR